MNEKIVEKLKAMEVEITSEKGEFSLFALVLREDTSDKYDLLVSAPWMEPDRKKSLEYMVKQVQAKLDPAELLSISRIIILEKGNPVLEAIQKSVSVKQGNMNVRNSNFGGLQITQACISTSSQVDPIVGN